MRDYRGFTPSHNLLHFDICIDNLPQAMRHKDANSHFLIQKYGNRAIIALGAGPTARGDLLKFRRGDIPTLIAVDQTIPMLEDMRIQPDIICCCDPDPNLVHVIVQYLNRRQPAILHISVVADVNSGFYDPAKYDSVMQEACFSDVDRNASLYCNSLESIMQSRLVEQAGIRSIPGWGSVGVMAHSLAAILSTEYVILAGLNNCFLPGGEATHCDGAPSARRLKNLEDSESMIWLYDKSGSWVSTQEVYHRYVQVHQDLIDCGAKQLKHVSLTDHVLFNCEVLRDVGPVVNLPASDQYRGPSHYLDEEEVYLRRAKARALDFVTRCAPENIRQHIMEPILRHSIMGMTGKNDILGIDVGFMGLRSWLGKYIPERIGEFAKSLTKYIDIVV